MDFVRSNSDNPQERGYGVASLSHNFASVHNILDQALACLSRTVGVVSLIAGGWSFLPFLERQLTFYFSHSEPQSSFSKFRGQL
ncbi:MAG: hypothetical protein ACFFCZ_17145 [Promethearchaeota archaeon]